MKRSLLSYATIIAAGALLVGCSSTGDKTSDAPESDANASDEVVNEDVAAEEEEVTKVAEQRLYFQEDPREEACMEAAGTGLVNAAIIPMTGGAQYNYQNPDDPEEPYQCRTYWVNEKTFSMKIEQLDIDTEVTIDKDVPKTDAMLIDDPREAACLEQIDFPPATLSVDIEDGVLLMTFLDDDEEYVSCTTSWVGPNSFRVITLGTDNDVNLIIDR